MFYFCSNYIPAKANWLNRLRVSRGFPTTTGLSLERYLSSLNNQNDSNTETHRSVTQNHSPPQPLDAQATDGGFTRITNALSELFCMGDHVPVSVSRRKCPRKQPNPRHFIRVVTSDSESTTNRVGGELGTRKTDIPSPVIDDNRRVGLPKETTNCGQPVNIVENVIFAEEEGEDEEKSRLTLAGFSKTEVTVIDTSFPGWKFEKMLFRKNRSWKALEKKSKGTTASGKKKKKRKICAMSEDRDGVDEVKKHRALQQGDSSKLSKGSSGSCNELGQVHLAIGSSYKQQRTSAVAVDKGPKKILDEGSSSNVLKKSLPSKKMGTGIFRISDEGSSSSYVLKKSLPSSMPISIDSSENEGKD